MLKKKIEQKQREKKKKIAILQICNLFQFQGFSELFSLKTIQAFLWVFYRAP